jgi:hypothetical protein
MDLAKAAPTMPDCQAAAAAAPARPAAYDTTLDHAPFETMEKYYPCPQAGISRSLMTGDVKGAQVCTTIRDPLDPMVKIKILDGLPPSFPPSLPPTETHSTSQVLNPIRKNKNKFRTHLLFLHHNCGKPEKQNKQNRNQTHHNNSTRKIKIGSKEKMKIGSS